MKYRDNRRRAGQHRHPLLAIPVICAILIGSAFTTVVAQAELVEYVAEPGTAGNKIVFLSGLQAYHEYYDKNNQSCP